MYAFKTKVTETFAAVATTHRARASWPIPPDEVCASAEDVLTVGDLQVTTGVILWMGGGRRWAALRASGSGPQSTAIADMRTGDGPMSRMNMRTILGLGAILTIGVGSWGMASTAAQTTPQSYTGQVREITIDQPVLEPEVYAGSLVLAQAGGQEINLAIPAGTSIRRGDQHVHLEALAIGNYVTVQATPFSPARQGNGRDQTWGEIDAYERSPIKSTP